MMMALKAQMHEDRTLPPGPPACIEVEDSPVEVHTPPPKTSVPPDTPDQLLLGQLKSLRCQKKAQLRKRETYGLNFH